MDSVVATATVLCSPFGCGTRTLSFFNSLKEVLKFFLVLLWPPGLVVDVLLE